ncbi:polysaccharide deacetylase family protein [Roseateles sp. NT4]|uniref:polysaccharide deacetylase family protein n=1 Tax=Roseateles sp. NT4 TaxID=3453715 RepID=UPI003EE99B9A
MARQWRSWWMVAGLAWFAVTGAAADPSPLGEHVSISAPVPIRLLLSFDDGPSAREGDNPTVQILDGLARNAIQPGIKAVFFVQTGASNGGATALGRELMRRTLQEGHALGFHTATPGHTSHTRLNDEVLEGSLSQGLAAHVELAGRAPVLVRPPHWAYDARTFAAYQRHGLNLVMTDLSANDGKIPWPNASLRRRSHLEHQMRVLRRHVNDLPVVGGVRPVVVTFHDANPFTGSHINEYLQILVDGAHKAGLTLADPPFYDSAESVEAAAQARALTDPSVQVRIPGFWTSLLAWILPEPPLD